MTEASGKYESPLVVLMNLNPELGLDDNEEGDEADFAENKERERVGDLVLVIDEIVV